MGIFLLIIGIVGLAALAFLQHANKNLLTNLRTRLMQRGVTSDEVEIELAEKTLVIPGFVTPTLRGLTAFGLVVFLFTGSFFYAEPGFKYHVRDIFGSVSVASTVGWHPYLFGKADPWKKEMTVQASSAYRGDTDMDEMGDKDESAASVSLPPLRVVFLDQVDAQVSATVRFAIPHDDEQFLQMVESYRTQTRLLRGTLVPAFQQTTKAVLMSADSYFSGERNKFNMDFELQMTDGIYVVKRTTRVINTGTDQTKGSANASLGRNQRDYGNGTKLAITVRPVLDDEGQPIRQVQSFNRYGITVVEARITNLVPNAKFEQRMEAKQAASAARSIAVEMRTEEVEKRLLAIAKGEREVAQHQAEALVAQITATTKAETTKQVAITKANQSKEKAEIAKATAQIELEKARIDALAVRVTADAAAHAKKVVLLADGALTQKLAAEIEIQAGWADAFAKRSVPTTVFGSGGSNGPSTGADGEAKMFMQLLTVDAAERLNYRRDISTTSTK